MVVEKSIIDSILDKYPNKKGALIPILQDIQNYLGYLSQDNLEYLSEKLNISLAHIYGVATFYSQFKLKKEGENIIEVCDGTACHVAGSNIVFDEIKKLLKIDVNETTKDNKFTLKTVRCLGACSFAPVMKINDKIYSRLTPEKIKEIIENYKK